MEFRIQKKENENIHSYPTEDLKLAQKFSTLLKSELGDFMLASVVFGSSVRRESTKHSDIDVLVVSDDATFMINDALVESYRIIVENVIGKVSPNFTSLP